MTQQQTFGEPLETFVGAAKYDSKGREIGFIVGLNDDGAGDFRAWVQSARKPRGGDFAQFGVPQRSKGFATQESATNWAYSTARARIAALR